jgi:hypothetical protein
VNRQSQAAFSNERANAPLTVVIRSSGERTVHACRELLAQQVCPQHVHTISETPFVRAVERTFEIGIAQQRPWTLAIDADVLPTPDAVRQLLSLTAQLAPSAFELQGMVLDKLLGGPRAAGNHLFRTALLPEALRHIRTEEVARSLRPETYVLRRMAEAGHEWIQHDLVVGLHDYEQYYRDIYRTAFVHAHKHNRQLPYVMALWKRLAETDRDYQVALWGARDGLAHRGEVRIDVRQFSDSRLQEHLQTRGWSEKPELDATQSVAPAHVIQTFEAPPEYWLWRHLGTVAGGPWRQRITQLSKHVAWPTILYWLARGGMRRLSHRIR